MTPWTQTGGASLSLFLTDVRKLLTEYERMLFPFVIF